MNRSAEMMDKTDRTLLAVLRQIFAACLARLRERAGARPQRLRIVERQALGPKQTLVLIEADGRPLLIASSSDASPVFFPLAAPAFEESHERQDAESRRRGSASTIHLEQLQETPAPLRSRRRVL